MKSKIYSFDYLCRKCGSGRIKKFIVTYLNINQEDVSTVSDVRYWLSRYNVEVNEFATWIEMQEEPLSMAWLD